MSAKTEKFQFKNRNNHVLDGMLEWPAKKPKAFAIFAHCFTCSKNIKAASVISKKLTDSGIAVLRFDFTGIGNSEGDFSNSGFSSNVQDLEDASSALSEKFESPSLLIGHSLGGAAVLSAAQNISSIKAVVAIAAPSSPKHVEKHMECSVDEIKSKGKAKVKIGERDFEISKEFIEDLNSIEIDVSKLEPALLLMHSPTDNVVSIDHAAHIYTQAKHPKSFVSLDGMDHLLSKFEDSEYVAQVIGAWSTRYLHVKEDSNCKDIPDHHVIVESKPGYKYTQDIWTNSHHNIADEPKSLGGRDLGPNPYDYLLSALGACTSMTLRMYADHKKLALNSVHVHLSHEKKKNDQGEKQDFIHKVISVTGDLTEDQKNRLLEIAEKCPVNKTLLSNINISSELG